MIDEYFANFCKIINSSFLGFETEIKIRKINDFIGIIEGKIIFDFGVLDILEVIKIHKIS